MKTEILGVQYDNVTMQEALAQARTLLGAQTSTYCVTPNAEMAYDALKDPAFRALLNGAGLVLPDGAGVVLAAKLLRRPLRQKVAGVEFAQQLLAVMEETGSRLYLLGGKPGVAELAAEKIRTAHPRLCICGLADGYFQDEAAAVAQVRAAAPDVVFVCLGSPKQEQFMQRHCDTIQARLLIGLGGTLDALAGTVKRAPRWMIRLQLEWLYRLLRQPSRFRRMLRLPKYLCAALRARMKGASEWES